MRVWRPSSGITAPNGSVYRRDDSNQCEIAGCSSEAASTQRGIWLAEDAAQTSFLSSLTPVVVMSALE